MEEFVYIDGKKYRRGYTTGSCAAAASKAAIKMFLTKKIIDTVSIDTPKMIKLDLKIENQEITDDYAVCSVKKDGGDDIDATHGLDIFARVEIVTRDKTVLKNKNELVIVTGGEGVGTVTKKGLSIKAGMSAINPSPLKMIKKEVEEVIKTTGTEIINENQSVKITIFVPNGLEISKKTLNPKLGIVGGISIIGTSGIVEPMSDESWKKSISIELEMKKEYGFKSIVFVPGNYGVTFVRDTLKLDEKNTLKISNFLGYMLLEAKRMDFKKILIAGHIGKLIKVSGGIFNTHSKVADARSEILMANLALLKAPYNMLKQVEECLTIEASIDLVEKYGYSKVYDVLCDKARKRALEHLKVEDNSIDVEVIMFSMDGNTLGKSQGAYEMVEVFK